MSLAHAPKTTCPRCLELRPSEIHTCSPSLWARKMEARIEELDDFRVAVAKALGIPAEASNAQLIDAINRL